jgi:hypothetical protein
MKTPTLISILTLILAGCGDPKPDWDDFLRITNVHYFIRDVPVESSLSKYHGVSIGLRSHSGDISYAMTVYSEEKDDLVELFLFPETWKIGWKYGNNTGITPIAKLIDQTWLTSSVGKTEGRSSDYLMRLSKKKNVTGGDFPAGHEIDIVVYHFSEPVDTANASNAAPVL